MDFLIRAWKQNIRKPMKSLMIFLVMVVIANLIVTGLFILKGTEKATKATLNQMTPIVYYMQDHERFWRAMELGFIAEDEVMPPISIETALELGKSDVVKAYDFSSSNMIGLKGLKAYKDPNNNESDWLNDKFDENMIVEDSTILRGGGMIEGDEIETFEVIGTSSTDFKVAAGTLELIEGQGISATDIEQENNIILIEERFAKANNLSVGDTLTGQFRLIWSDEQYRSEDRVEKELEIAGIYRNLSVQDGSDYWMNERVANQFYMPYNVLNQYISEATDIDFEGYVVNGEMTAEEAEMYRQESENYTINTIGFLLHDPLKVYDFITDSKSILPSDYHVLKVGDSTFDSIAKSIDNMTQTSNLIIYIVFGAGILILSLITSLTLKSREYEIGVLLSLGESKVRVVGQLISELLIIAFAAFSLSIVTGNLIANYYGQEMLQAQMEAAMSSSNNNYIYTPDGNYGDTEGGLQYTDFVNNFDIQLEPMVYVELMTYGMAVVVISALVPMIFIMRYNPKAILSIR